MECGKTIAITRVHLKLFEQYHNKKDLTSFSMFSSIKENRNIRKIKVNIYVCIKEKLW